MSLADTNPEYWREYSNLQHVKHALIREYLNGWLPKMTLGQWGCSRLLYIDTHAGRGKHLDGQLGSPLVALTTLLNHQSRDKLLQKTEMRFFFIERDAANVAALNEELAVHTLPPKVYAKAEHGDSFQIIEDAITGARWGTHIRMLDSGRIRYFLLHLTKHDDGRDLMKECIWKACPDGGFYASKSDNPRQQLLIQSEPNLSPLREWVTEKLTAAPKRWQDLMEDLREELWLSKHLNEAIRDMRQQGKIEGDGFTGKFAEKNNPLLRLNDRPKQLELF